MKILINLINLYKTNVNSGILLSKANPFVVKTDAKFPLPYKMTITATEKKPSQTV